MPNHVAVTTRRAFVQNLPMLPAVFATPAVAQEASEISAKFRSTFAAWMNEQKRINSLQDISDEELDRNVEGLFAIEGELLALPSITYADLLVKVLVQTVFGIFDIEPDLMREIICVFGLENDPLVTDAI